MSRYPPEIIEHSSRQTVLVFSALVFFVLLAVSMLFLQFLYVYPDVVQQINKHTENEAVRAGRHMSRVVLQGYSDGEIQITSDIESYLNQASKDMSFWKIKVFLRSGEVAYSTEAKDVGSINEHPYFQEVVAKGELYSKFVKKDAVSLDGQQVTLDVIETYVPIMIENKFIGAFEIYYNVTEQKNGMENLASRSTLYMGVLSGAILLMAVIFYVIFNKIMRARHRYEKLLFYRANNDSLTRVYTRRRFEELFELEVERFRRYKENSVLIMLDLDHFKAVNDQYGHQVGDEVLSTVAKACNDLLRANDILGRYGGEEFVICLPNTAAKQAPLIAEKLRLCIKSLHFPHVKNELRVTASSGVSSFEDFKDISVDAIMKVTDDALYVAKAQGRDCFVVAPKVAL